MPEETATVESREEKEKSWMNPESVMGVSTKWKRKIRWIIWEITKARPDFQSICRAPQRLSEPFRPSILGHLAFSGRVRRAVHVLHSVFCILPRAFASRTSSRKFTVNNSSICLPLPLRRGSYKTVLRILVFTAMWTCPSVYMWVQHANVCATGTWRASIRANAYRPFIPANETRILFPLWSKVWASKRGAARPFYIRS